MDLSQPPDRHAVEPEPVAEQRAQLEPVGRREDPEVEPRRRDRLEVVRVGEESERLLDAASDDLGALELRRHVSSRSTASRSDVTSAVGARHRAPAR